MRIVLIALVATSLSACGSMRLPTEDEAWGLVALGLLIHAVANHDGQGDGFCPGCEEDAPEITVIIQQ